MWHSWITASHKLYRESSTLILNQRRALPIMFTVSSNPNVWQITLSSAETLTCQTDTDQQPILVRNVVFLFVLIWKPVPLRAKYFRFLKSRKDMENWKLLKFTNESCMTFMHESPTLSQWVWLKGKVTSSSLFRFSTKIRVVVSYLKLLIIQ